jgi:hypothetical protein
LSSVADDTFTIPPTPTLGDHQEVKAGVLRCLDLDEEAPLPEKFSVGTKSYKELKEETKYECSTARP